MLKDKLSLLLKNNSKEEDGKQPANKKIENLVVFLILLIITVIVINVIWNDDKKKTNQQENVDDKNKKLATEILDAGSEAVATSTNPKSDIEKSLEDILGNINGVGKVKVMITYSKTSETVPLYNEDSSQKDTEESDKQGGTRKVKETDTKKEIIYKEESGTKVPITQSIISPEVEGAIITAEGAGNPTVKTNIIQAVEAVTGVPTHKVQVFKMEGSK